MTTLITYEKVSANGLTFDVAMCGQGERLALCLHGFPESAFSWRCQMPVLVELGYRVWAPNLRGYGNSDRPRGVRNYAMPHLRDDIAGLIDAANARDVTLIAHDWGAAIAWDFALRKVRPLSRFVVLNMPHPAIFAQAVRRWPQLLRSWYILFFQLPWLPEWLLSWNNGEWIARAFRDMAIDKTRFPDDILAEYRRNALLPGALTAMLNYYRAALRYADLPEPMPRLDIPTLMIWGEEDSALGKELTLGTDALVEDFTLRYLPRISHWVQQEAPDQVNAILAAWLSGETPPVYDD